MANLKRVASLALMSLLLVLGATACGGGTAPAPTAAPSKPAAAPTTAPAAPAAQPTAAAAPAGGEIPVGMNVSVTGPSAAQGALFIKAIQLAEKQINDGGGVNGKKVKVYIEDNQSTNPGALAALNRAAEQDKVVAVIGPVMSTQVQAVSDADKQLAIPMLSGGTAVKNTHMGNPWMFRFRPDDSLSAAAMVQYTKEDLKLTKIGILHDSDAFGTAGADLVEQYAKDAGLTVVKREKYTTNDKDFTAQLLSLKNAGTEIMVVYAPHPEDSAIIQRQYTQLGRPYKYIGSAGSAAKDDVDLAKSSATGLMAVVDYVPGYTDESKKYVADYKAMFNADIDGMSAWNYDALMILANAMKKVGEDKTKIRDALLATQNYKGACGTFSFSSNGDGLHEVSVAEIQDGGGLKLLKVVTIKPQP